MKNEQVSEILSQIEKLKEKVLLLMVEEVDDVEKLKEEKAEALFLDFIAGAKVRGDIKSYPSSVFYFKGDICLFEISNNKILWVNYKNFGSEFILPLKPISGIALNAFIKKMVEKHLRLIGLDVRSDWSNVGQVDKRQPIWDSVLAIEKQ